ncbi:MAG: methyltransferase domain-containing protein [Ruminiclostridium sp.]|nr:methyltransferase domain-containing protein [Ruminiclostridium sp.]
MTNFICPICRNELVQNDKSLKCEVGHCFDISRKGTVNLLVSNKSRHGDDKRMVAARKSFLDKGYYEPLRAAVRELTAKYAYDGCTLLDCGCGECSYTADIAAELHNIGITAELIGIDVSKDAVNAGASRHAGIRLAAASVFDIPLSDGSCGIVLALFSPFSGSEYLRVLKEDGVYITAFPLENHLFELKQAVYEKPYRNTVSPLDVNGFELLEYKECRFSADLASNEDIIALFEMTPYCYKTSATDRAKLDRLGSLTVSAEFGIAAYRKAT